MLKIKLAELAERLGKNASEIARETGINRNTINALMGGHVEDVKFSTLEKISKTYGIKVLDILEENASTEHGFVVPPKRTNQKIYKQEGEVVPFTSWPWILTAGSFELEHGGKKSGFGQLDVYFKEDYGLVYWDLNALKDLAETFYKICGDREKFTKLYNKYLVYAAEIEDSYGTLYDDHSGNMHDARLKAAFNRLQSAYSGFWACSLFIDAFDTGVDQEKIKAIAAEHSLDKKAIEVLTTPTEMTFDDERKYLLLSIIKSHRTSNGDALDQYKKKFDYYKSNYSHIKHISDKEIKEEIGKYLKDKKLFKADHERLDSYARDKQEEINALLKKYRLKENPLWFFNGITYWREHRKKVNLMGIHALDFILSMLEEKTGIQRKYLSYLSFDEVENVLKRLIPDATLRRRRQDGMLVSVRGKDGYTIFEGQEAKSIGDELEKALSGDTAKTKVITGQTASQGYAKGIARIILVQEDFGRFNEGEVLVTSMTRPEFVPLMKKAVAIVTNEGGITCHAAIVSRELGKPCVIGTKNATKIIKDGDLIEVRANHGTVRILD